MGKRENCIRCTYLASFFLGGAGGGRGGGGGLEGGTVKDLYQKNKEECNSTTYKV